MKAKNLMMLFATALVLGFTTSCGSDDSKDDPKDPGTITPPEDPGKGLHESLKGTNYYLIALDETTKTQINSKVAKDYRVDDTNNFLDVWAQGETYAAGVSSGPNFYGEIEGWTALEVVAPAGWSGGAFRCASVDLTGVTGDYTLHIAMKSTDSKSHVLILGDGSNEAHICIGSEPFVDNTKTYQPYTNFTRDGEWHEIEIPMSYVLNQGVNYRAPYAGSIMSFLSGGTPGTKLNMDAIFIYKK